MSRFDAWKIVIDTRWIFPIAVVLTTWITAFFGAWLTFACQTPGPHTVGRFVAFCFPRRIFGSQLRLDVAFSLARKFGYPLFVAPFIISSTVVSYFCYESLAELLGVAPAAEPTWPQWAFCVLVFVAYQDFGNFYYHLLMHRVWWLWEFHKVHHSATVLTPPTNRRFHPLQDIFENIVYQIPPGMFIGIYSYFMHVKFVSTLVIGIDSWFFVNMLSFYHLRHSHIYFRYPQWLERWIMSPAQHQIHHSRNAEHVDRNFGVFTSVWDRLWGTIVYSDTTAPGKFELGLTEAQECYTSLLKLYYTPFVNYWNVARRRAYSLVLGPRHFGSDSAKGLPRGKELWR